jgi:hypothetical protein
MEGANSPSIRAFLGYPDNQGQGELSGALAAVPVEAHDENPYPLRCCSPPGYLGPEITAEYRHFCTKKSCPSGANQRLVNTQELVVLDRGRKAVQLLFADPGL